MPTLVPLTQGQFAIVDDEDAESVMLHKWSATRKRNIWYAHRSTRVAPGKTITTFMHRQIMNAPRGIQVDHENGNGLDNQRHNLRLATRFDQMANTRRQRGASGYRGVHKRGARWSAKIERDTVVYCLGTFSTPQEAARAYDAKARELQGDFATLNFPDQS